MYLQTNAINEQEIYQIWIILEIKVSLLGFLGMCVKEAYITQQINTNMGTVPA